MDTRLDRLYRVTSAYVLLFVLWGVFRLLIRLPAAIEEAILKPLVFVGSVLWAERPKHAVRFFRSVWGHGSAWKGVAIGLAGGLGYVAFFVATATAVFGGITMGSSLATELWVSFVASTMFTALWDEWIFTGYFLGELQKMLRGSWTARFLTSVLFALTYLPILLFWYRFTGATLLYQLFLLSALGVGSMLLMASARTLWAPITARALWGIAVAALL